jgi:hypothetical protein
MKNFILGALCSVLFLPAFSQETTAPANKQREVGLTFRNFDGFGLTYRFGKENKLWRLNATSGALSFSSSDLYIERESVNVSFLASVGREIRKPLGEKIDFRYGLDLGIGFSYSESELSDTTRVSSSITENTQLRPELGVLVGFNYKVSDKFLIGAELIPQLFYAYSEYSGERLGNEFEGSSHDYGLSFSNLAVLSVIYSF